MHMRENLYNNRHRCNLLIGRGILSSFYYFHVYNILFFLLFDAIEDLCSLSQLLLLVKLVNFVYLHPQYGQMHPPPVTPGMSPQQHQQMMLAQQQAQFQGHVMSLPPPPSNYPVGPVGYPMEIRHFSEV